MNDETYSFNKMIEHKMGQAVTEAQIIVLKNLLEMDRQLLTVFKLQGLEIAKEMIRRLQENLEKLEREGHE